MPKLNDDELIREYMSIVEESAWTDHGGNEYSQDAQNNAGITQQAWIRGSQLNGAYYFEVQDVDEDGDPFEPPKNLRYYRIGITSCTKDPGFAEEDRLKREYEAKKYEESKNRPEFSIYEGTDD